MLAYILLIETLPKALACRQGRTSCAEVEGESRTVWAYTKRSKIGELKIHRLMNVNFKFGSMESGNRHIALGREWARA